LPRSAVVRYGRIVGHHQALERRVAMSRRHDDGVTIFIALASWPGAKKLARTVSIRKLSCHYDRRATLAGPRRRLEPRPRPALDHCGDKTIPRL
jgi:hypothetical protein